MGLVREGNRKTAERGRQAMLRRFAQREGYLYRMHDDVLGSWFVCGARTPPSDIDDVTIVTWDSAQFDSNSGGD